jgi:hypothetical protein
MTTIATYKSGETVPSMDEWNALIAKAEELGRERGRDVASWFEVNERDTARVVLGAIEDGDPMVLDGLPYVDLSGEWADDYSLRNLLDDLDLESDSDDGALGTAFMDAANEQVIDDVETTCRRMLED